MLSDGVVKCRRLLQQYLHEVPLFQLLSDGVVKCRYKASQDGSVDELVSVAKRWCCKVSF